ncbi:MAG: flagellin [Alphaproteobacteria bacterium]|nr:flagellin [Alphaproteobacteria bacterium]
MAMNNSVNTNVSAMVALQNLNSTNRMLDSVQERVNTGLRVSNAQDDASSYQISNVMKGDKRGYESVQIALGLGLATVNTAMKAAESISDLLIEMKAKVVQANQSGLDNFSQSALNTDITNLANQISTIVQSANFNGRNLIQSGATSMTVLSTVSGSVISVSAVSLDTTALAVNTMTVIGSSGAAAALSTINSAIQTASSRIAQLGASARTVDLQNEFVSKFVDILTEGIGQLIDADLAKESATLQALQVKQQLGVQALSIANAKPQTLLGLFGG